MRLNYHGTVTHLLTWDADVARFIQYHCMSTNNVNTIYCCTEYMHNKLLMWMSPYHIIKALWKGTKSIYIAMHIVEQYQLKWLQEPTGSK
jgi:hypothetical protein